MTTSAGVERREPPEPPARAEWVSPLHLARWYERGRVEMLLTWALIRGRALEVALQLVEYGHAGSMRWEDVGTLLDGILRGGSTFSSYADLERSWQHAHSMALPAEKDTTEWVDERGWNEAWDGAPAERDVASGDRRALIEETEARWPGIWTAVLTLAAWVALGGVGLVIWYLMQALGGGR